MLVSSEMVVRLMNGSLSIRMILPLSFWLFPYQTHHKLGSTNYFVSILFSLVSTVLMVIFQSASPVASQIPCIILAQDPL